MTIAGEFYHITGRIHGMKREKQYSRFFQTATRLFKRRCEMLAYCLMPDQYELLLLEHEDESIPALLVRLESVWAKEKPGNSGGAEGRYTLKTVESDEALIRLSGTLHSAPVARGLCRVASEWAHSSLADYTGKGWDRLVHTDYVMRHFDSAEAYESFVNGCRA